MTNVSKTTMALLVGGLCTMASPALEKSYLLLAPQEAMCRPRIDTRIPTSDPACNYQWGTME